MHYTAPGIHLQSHQLSVTESTFVCRAHHRAQPEEVVQVVIYDATYLDDGNKQRVTRLLQHCLPAVPQG